MFLQRSIFDVIPKIEDKVGTLIYVDPPYLVKSARYIHDFKLEQHQRMHQLLSRFRRTRVVVSYYPHPEICTLYESWGRHDIPVTKRLGAASDTGVRAATETLFYRN